MSLVYQQHSVKVSLDEQKRIMKNLSIITGDNETYVSDMNHGRSYRFWCLMFPVKVVNSIIFMFTFSSALSIMISESSKQLFSSSHKQFLYSYFSLVLLCRGIINRKIFIGDTCSYLRQQISSFPLTTISC